MPYVLGIDLGGTRTTAAVSRRSGPTFGPPEVVPLDGPARWVDSVLHLSPDASVLVGQAAHRLAAGEPERIARGVVRRVGDDVPVLLGDDYYPAEVLAAALAAWVVDLVAEAEGGPAERLVVAHPADWGPHRKGLLHAALGEAGVPGALLLSSMIAAAESHHAAEPVETGYAVAVCRIGGEHAEAAVLHRTPAGFDQVLHAAGADPEAGAHLDDLLLGAVLARLARDEAGPVAPEVTARLRAACAGVKERLSVAKDATVGVPGVGEVTLTRTEFERLARPVLAAAVGQVRRTARAVPADQLAAVVLAGGTARIPMLTDLAATMLDSRVSVDPDPGTAVCRGAALAARPRIAEPPAGGTAIVPVVRHTENLLAGKDEVGPPPPRPPVQITPLEPPPRRFAMARRGRRDSETDRDEDGR